jgi:hypothetical protein
VVLDEAPDRLAILSAATQDVDDSIKQLLGDDSFAIFATYQGTIQTRKFVLQPLAERLQFGAEPLRSDQLDQLAASVPPYYFGIQQYIMSGPAPELPESLDAAAKRVLTAVQLEAYKEYKNVWECQTAKTRLDQELVAQNIRAKVNASTH